MDALRVISTRSFGAKKYILANKVLPGIFENINKKDTASLLNIGYANMIASIKKNS